MESGMTSSGLHDLTIAVVVEMDKFQGFLRSRIVRTNCLGVGSEGEEINWMLVIP